MNSLSTPKTSRSNTSKSGVNPFARALAETEQSLNRGGQAGMDGGNNPFRDALAKTGGKFDFNQGFDSHKTDTIDPEQQRLQLERQRKKDALRRKLHDKVNPVDLVDVYNAREQQVKKEIDKLRDELKMLVKEVKKFDQEVQITLMTEVVKPGQDGKYYIAFFQQLRTFIMLLRQKIHSAHTWATQLHGKQKKKQKKGMQIGGQAHEKTSTIQDMMHHERSSQYSGG